VVVDAIDPGCLVSDCNSKLFDFGSASAADLENIVIPLRLQAGARPTAPPSPGKFNAW
jgi:hypothetical protein